MLKWKDPVSPGITLPTQYGKEKIDSLQGERQKVNHAMMEEMERLRQTGADQSQVDKIRAKYRKLTSRLNEEIERVRAQYAHLRDKVGGSRGRAMPAKGCTAP